jgi:hypothetical protein
VHIQRISKNRRTEKRVLRYMLLRDLGRDATLRSAIEPLNAKGFREDVLERK